MFARFILYDRRDKMNKGSFYPFQQFAPRIALIAIQPIERVHRRVGSKWLVSRDTMSALPPDFRSSADAQPELERTRRDFWGPFNSA